MASLDEIRELLNKQTVEFEAKMVEALAAQEARLTAKFVKQKGQTSNPEIETIKLEGEVPNEPESETQKMKERLEMLEKSLASIKKDGLDINSLSLFPKARLPPKFHMPNMDKFDGTSCPKTHLKMYLGALNPHGLDNELLAQLFQQSLTGAALKWFMSLDLTKIKTWEDICNVFNKQYHYNIEVDVTRRELETTKQKNGEFFSSFLTRWRAKAAQMINRPTEQEQGKGFTI